MQPSPYVPATNFQQEETNAVAGRSTVRTARVDVEFQAISLTLSQILTNLAVIQRDDTQLQDLAVTTASLSANVKALFVGGVNPRGAWITATAYAVKDVVETGTPLVSYICVTAHTSGTFATDRSAGKWMVLGQEPGTLTITNIVLTTGGITLGTNNTQDLAATANRFRSGYFGTSVFATISVVTPLLGTDTAANINFKTNGTNRWAIDGTGTFAFFPATDNTVQIGGPANRVSALFAPIIDSGTTGSVLLKTNNGTTGFEVFHNAGGVNFLRATSGTTGNAAVLRGVGSDAAIAVNYFAKGNAGHHFFTDDGGTGPDQFEILNTNSANRRITVTGSNGGNPTIGVTAGSLAITPTVVFGAGITLGASPTIAVASGSLTITPNVVISGGQLTIVGGGTSPTGGVLNVGNNPTPLIRARNNADNGNLDILSGGPVNSVTDVYAIGASYNAAGNPSAGVLVKARSGAAAPTTSDLPSGMSCVWRDTAGATTKLYYNNAGAIQSVALA